MDIDAGSRKNSVDDVAELEKCFRLLSKNQDTKIQMDSQLMEDKQTAFEESKRQNQDLRSMIKQMQRELGYGGKTMQEREKEQLETKVGGHIDWLIRLGMS